MSVTDLLDVPVLHGDEEAVKKAKYLFMSCMNESKPIFHLSISLCLFYFSSSCWLILWNNQVIHCILPYLSHL